MQKALKTQKTKTKETLVRTSLVFGAGVHKELHIIFTFILGYVILNSK